MCWEAPDKFCHRHIVSEWLSLSLGVKVEEYKTIDDLIDEWHEVDNDLELHEYLGMSLEEYNNFIEGK